MPTVAVIADDLTGALEMGALLAARGLRTIVTIQGSPDIDCDAVVIDTESRNATERESVAFVRAAAQTLRAAGIQHVFKKIDSTLRGWIAAELLAFREEFPDGPLFFTPAYPAIGRTVQEGLLRIDGIDLTATAFAQDPYWPVKSSRVQDYAPSGVAICDAATQDELRRIVKQAPAGALFAGSGGLGRAWAESIPAGSAHSAVAAETGRVLLVSGSRHPRSLEQAAHARRGGVRTISAPDELCAPSTVRQRLAFETAQEFDRQAAGTLILFGGETAAAVLLRLGIAELWPVRELMPGIAASTAHWQNRRLTVVTKAGGFGSVTAVDEILEELRK